VERFDAVVHKDNLSSMRLFEGLGFQPAGIDPPFCQFSRDWVSPKPR
jgi:RimJ/RimL family protein N-acetyltransferase